MNHFGLADHDTVAAESLLWSASESGPIGDGPDVSDTDVEITQSKNHGLTYQQSALLDSSDMDKTKTSQYMSGGFHLDRH